MLDYAQTHIFDAVTTCGRYQGCLLLIFILHNGMHAIRPLPVLYLSVTCHTPKWPPNVNRRRAPGVNRLRCNGYGHLQQLCALWYIRNRRPSGRTGEG